MCCCAASHITAVKYLCLGQHPVANGQPDAVHAEGSRKKCEVCFGNPSVAVRLDRAPQLRRLVLQRRKLRQHTWHTSGGACRVAADILHRKEPHVLLVSSAVADNRSAAHVVPTLASGCPQGRLPYELEMTLFRWQNAGTAHAAIYVPAHATLAPNQGMSQGLALEP